MAWKPTGFEPSRKVKVVNLLPNPMVRVSPRRWAEIMESKRQKMIANGWTLIDEEDGIAIFKR